MTNAFRAACLQLTPGNDLGRNLSEIERLAREAARAGARLVALPEFATYLDRDSRSMRSSATGEGASNALEFLRLIATDNGIWLLVGSLVILPDGAPEGRLANRSFLLSDAGEIVARYDKIHLFDARLSDGRAVGESRHYIGGDRAVVVSTPFGRIGMTVCYDLRFPNLYRALALAGADVLTVPAAFAAETGMAHWETLLRARAIETGCFVLAPATCGAHPGDWHTHGHAMIVDPWGRIVAQCGDETGVFCVAEIDTERVAEARSRIPSLSTNPAFSVVESGESKSLDQGGTL